MNRKLNWLQKSAFLYRKRLPSTVAILSSLLFCTYAFPASINLQKSAKDVLSREDFFSLKIVTKKAVTTEGSSPFSMRFDGDRCVLDINDSPSGQAVALARRIRPAHQKAFVESLVVREIAHCWRRQDNPEKYDRILAVGDVIAQRTQLIPWYRKAIQEEEMFSDIAALSWVEKFYPDSYAYLLTVFILWREEQVLSGNMDIDLSGLYRTRQFGMIYGETPFYAADTTLAMVMRRNFYQNAR